ncbi:MAG: corrinoid protein [Caldilineaceae bacterium]|nr:corrinoid protein [Caldilineaceae bacterium]HRJ44365.1 corrinoid protein [Caldilineaceae bacterium]
MSSEEILDQIYDGVLRGDTRTVTAGIQAGLAAGLDPQQLLDDAMVAAMEEIGHRFESNECFVPEMLIAARAMKEGVSVLTPHLVDAGVRSLGKVVIGTVRGDVHDIGKNLVRIMMESSGWEVIDLGVDVGPERYVAAVQEHQPRIVGLSALLTTTMPNMKLIIDALKNAGVRDQVKVMIGGAPVTQEYARQLGADLYALDAAAAAEIAKTLAM